MFPKQRAVGSSPIARSKPPFLNLQHTSAPKAEGRPRDAGGPLLRVCEPIWAVDIYRYHSATYWMPGV